ncbi:MAG: bis(5'-nucleosyl)-tetraphosphatase (symmetrical) YqeK [Negativicutes bacterium]|jgi:predicted HD superfamily hydrolase involved in NAD metabolism
MIINCTIEDLSNYLQEKLTIKRYQHSINVAKCAQQLAELHGVDAETAYIAGLLHDCGRGMSDDELLTQVYSDGRQLDEIEMRQPVLLHASYGAVIAKNVFAVSDNDILNAIRNHTIADTEMSVLEKIIYLADMIEPDRKFDGVKRLRKLAEGALDVAMSSAFDISIKYVIKAGKLLHPKTIAARNELLIMRGKQDETAAKK